MLCVDKQQIGFSRHFVPSHTKELCIYGISYSCEVVFFTLLGICLHIMCFTPSVWEVQSDEMANGEVQSRRRRASLRLSRSHVSELSSWITQMLMLKSSLSLLSCCLSSICWEVASRRYVICVIWRLRTIVAQSQDRATIMRNLKIGMHNTISRLHKFPDCAEHIHTKQGQKCRSVDLL